LILKGHRHCRTQIETKENINHESISEIHDEDNNDDFDDPRDGNDDEQS
jgi:hypothetical protein